MLCYPAVNISAVNISAVLSVAVPDPLLIRDNVILDDLMQVYVVRVDLACCVLDNGGIAETLK